MNEDKGADYYNDDKDDESTCSTPTSSCSPPYPAFSGSTSTFVDHLADHLEDVDDDEDEEKKKDTREEFKTHLGFLHVPHNKLAHHFLPSLNNDDC